MNYKIIVNHQNRIANTLYTYSSREEIEPGTRVIIPFGRGNSLKMGMVVARDEEEHDFTVKEIKEIIDEEPIVDREMIDLAFFMRDYYLSDLPSALQTVMPPGNWQNIEELFTAAVSKEEPLYRFLEKKRSWKEIREKFPSLSRTELLKAVENGSIDRSFGLDREPDYRYLVLYRKNPEFDEKALPTNAPAQKKILDTLGDRVLSRKEILKDAGVSAGPFKTLEEKGAFIREEKKIPRRVVPPVEHYKKHVLNEEQRRVVEKIRPEHKKYLLHGVTGSGKTEVYLHLVEKTLKEGKDAIVLVPEISLTPQTIRRFAGRFNEEIAVIHSKLSLAERFEQYRLIKEGKVHIVVGARSAIFSPFKNLGLIIIDEEHELSYRSEQNPKYDAKTVAERRAAYHDATILLGSATPGIDEYYESRHGDYELLELTRRATESGLPDTKIVDMKDELKKGNTSMISEELGINIKERLRRKEQTILFLNKRGHTSFFLCRRCGYVLDCDFCDVSMTYHKSKDRLVCHLCGRTRKKPSACPNCGSKAMKEFGGGTEKLEEEIRAMFPEARIMRMDSDTVGKKEAYETVDRRMRKGEIDILIGTQMLSKGFDFDNVTLVGVVSADISLNAGNYRANERTFQLITQVAGRAGRGKRKGKVIIQTYKPEHFAIIRAARNDYKGFYKEEINKRKFYEYPPFYKMINLKVSHKNRFLCRTKALEIAGRIQRELEKKKISLLMTGPNPSPVERINDYYRFDINYKLNRDLPGMKEILQDVILYNKYDMNFDGTRINITFDPVSFY